MEIFLVRKRILVIYLVLTVGIVKLNDIVSWPASVCFYNKQFHYVIAVAAWLWNSGLVLCNVWLLVIIYVTAVILFAVTLLISRAAIVCVCVHNITCWNKAAIVFFACIFIFIDDFRFLH